MEREGGRGPVGRGTPEPRSEVASAVRTERVRVGTGTWSQAWTLVTNSEVDTGPLETGLRTVGSSCRVVGVDPEDVVAPSGPRGSVARPGVSVSLPSVPRVVSPSHGPSISSRVQRPPSWRP